jgi:hypothetical protein
MSYAATVIKSITSLSATANEPDQFRWYRVQHQNEPKHAIAQTGAQVTLKDVAVERVHLVGVHDDLGERGHVALPEMSLEDLLLQGGDVEAAQAGCVGEDLGDDGAPSLGVGGKFDLDDRQAPGRFDRDEISIVAAECDLPPDD